MVSGGAARAYAGRAGGEAGIADCIRSKLPIW